MPASPTPLDILEWRPPTEADIDAIHDVYRAADPIDHPTWVTPREDISDTFALSYVDPARDMIVGTSKDGTVVAFGQSTLHPSREEEVRAYVAGVVHPEWRRRGIGTELMRWQFARAHEQIAHADGPPSSSIHVFAEEHDEGLVALAESFGMQTERWFTSMVRDMAQLAPERAAPEGIVLVPFEKRFSDAARVARNDAFRDHWGSLPTDPERWSTFAGGPYLRGDLSTLAMAGDRVVAFCLASVNEDDWAALGASNSYIDLIGVVRDYRGTGLAPTVIARTLQAIADAGLEKAVLDVDTASPTGANTLYTRLGFVATHRERAFVARFGPEPGQH